MASKFLIVCMEKEEKLLDEINLAELHCCLVKGLGTKLDFQKEIAFAVVLDIRDGVRLRLTVFLIRYAEDFNVNLNATLTITGVSSYLIISYFIEQVSGEIRRGYCKSAGEDVEVRDIATRLPSAFPLLR